MRHQFSLTTFLITGVLASLLVTLSPPPLLAAKGSLNTDLDSAFSSLENIVRLGINSHFQFKEFKTNFNAQTLAGMLGIKAKLRGTVYFDLKNVTLSGGQLKRATGLIQWKQAAIESPFKLKLGNIRIRLKSKSKISGTIINTGAKLRLNGKFQISKNKRYHIELTLKSTSRIEPSIAIPLKAFGGHIDQQGQLVVKYSGRLNWIPKK